MYTLLSNNKVRLEALLKQDWEFGNHQQDKHTRQSQDKINHYNFRRSNRVQSLPPDKHYFPL